LFDNLKSRTFVQEDLDSSKLDLLTLVKFLVELMKQNILDHSNLLSFLNKFFVQIEDKQSNNYSFKGICVECICKLESFSASNSEYKKEYRDKLRNLLLDYEISKKSRLRFMIQKQLDSRKCAIT
jgi:hypothetical protein